MKQLTALFLALLTAAVFVLSGKAYEPLKIRANSPGCVKYTYGMVTTSFSQHLYHGDCKPVDKPAKEDRPAKVETQDTPVVIVVTPEPPVTPVVTETPVTPVVEETPMPETPEACDNGNPGTHACVGKAGENPNGRGTMPLDSTDGNGQHGNQGVNHP